MIIDPCPLDYPFKTFLKLPLFWYLVCRVQRLPYRSPCPPKWMNFRKKYKQLLTPPHFGICCFLQICINLRKFTNTLVGMEMTPLPFEHLLKGKICIKFFVSEMTPLPFGFSPDIHPFWRVQTFLSCILQNTQFDLVHLWIVISFHTQL